MGSRRWANVRTPAEYVSSGSPRIDEVELDEERRLQDFLLAGLRRTQGVHLEPEQMDAIAPPARRMIERGWLERPGPGRLRLTPQGVLFSNEVFQELLFQ